MATRPVYYPKKTAPYVDAYSPEFTWNGGFAVSQKQKNIAALHEAFQRRFPERKILEISSKSLQPLGVNLSAFNLKKYVPSLDKSVPLECVFQGGKVFSSGGPYTDLYEKTSREAKKDERLKTSGFLKSFYYEEKEISLFPKTAFYDWLYINALLESPKLASEIVKYDAFTDIEFNPNKSVNSQAKSAALFVSLYHRGVVEECRNYDRFLELLK